VQLRKWKSLFYSFSFTWIAFLFLISIFANFIANEKPLFAQYKQQNYFPVIYDILSDFGLYQWDSELANKDWKTLDLEASWWAPIPFSPEQLDLDNAPAKPPFSVLTVKNKKFYHYLGTDELGRDIASGLIYGARYAIIIGVSATFLAAIFGIFLGSIAGFWGDYDFKISRYSLFILLSFGLWAFFISFYSRYYQLQNTLSLSFFSFLTQLFFSTLLFCSIILICWKGFSFLKKKYTFLQKNVAISLDILISRVIEIKLSIPMLLIIIILTAIAKPSIFLLIGIIAFGQWTLFARLIRAEILKIKNLEYISVTKIQGLPSLKILLRHVLPNAMPPIWVSISFAVASAILVESALSFLGISSSHVSWGSLLKSGRNDLNAWWLVLFPGSMIFFTIFALNQFNENLRKILNPKKL